MPLFWKLNNVKNVYGDINIEYSVSPFNWGRWWSTTLRYKYIQTQNFHHLIFDECCPNMHARLTSLFWHNLRPDNPDLLKYDIETENGTFIGAYPWKRYLQGRFVFKYEKYINWNRLRGVHLPDNWNGLEVHLPDNLFTIDI